jgi:hypothetical protein
MKLYDLWFEEARQRSERLALDLLETKSTGPFDAGTLAPAIKHRYIELWRYGKVIGESGGSKILQMELDGVFAVGACLYDRRTKTNAPISFIVYEPKKVLNRQYSNVILVHSLATVNPDLRRERSMKKLLDFFIAHTSDPVIELEGLQSDEAITMIRALSKRLKTYWLNVKTGETAAYDRKGDNPGLSPYRSRVTQTEWRIVFEPNGRPIAESDGDEYMRRVILRGLPNEANRYSLRSRHP